MPRKNEIPVEDMTPFAGWMMGKVRQKGWDLKRLATETGIDYTYLWKITRAHTEKYKEYWRPGYSYTIRIGAALGDTQGATQAAEFGEVGETSDTAADWAFLDAAARDVGYDGLEDTGMTAEQIAQVDRAMRALAATFLKEQAPKKK